MEVLDQVEQVQDNNQSSPSEDGGVAAPPAAQAVVPAEKSGLEKLREKAATGIAPAAKTEVELAADAAKTALTVFKPNLKFKAAGKEMDVPPLLQALLKDPESEKYIHQMLSKAHGIEMIQDKLKSTRDQRDQADQAYRKVMEPINFASEAYKRGDLDIVFQTLKIDPNKVLQWAYRQVELSQMPPDQRQVHEARTAAERRNFELERQSQAQMHQGQTSQAEQINQMLDLVMERQDVSALAQAYDTKKGKEGSFRDLVVLMGEQAFNQGKMISPLDAAKQAAELLGEKFGATQAAAQAPPVAQVPPAQTQAPEKKIVLPNAGGSKAAAPGKSKIKSIDDLKKKHAEMASSNN